ncbi:MULTISPECIES: hypothetical protein [Rhodanobacter]|nr:MULTISPECIES: hypothetical protein [Rhodanobacter]EIM00290.1 hypothetical protein UUC_13730 [Rhodanobacter denitrificans]KZC18654.1 hypothetical protein RHOFW104R3_35480 [Rhodanobacter denitrificans]
MRWMPLMAAVGFVTVSAAWAGDRATSLPTAPAPAKSLSTVQRHLAGSQAEVKRLKQDLDRQELDSRRASERLKQQDQAIAELQRRLHELQAGPAPGSR